ncbi:hypothetical protein DER44DRAFT_874718 [Fusarium oxysporum]|nr:hypothetical protein DER44DRAFT_874718 [Fusarium oxysporum]
MHNAQHRRRLFTAQISQQLFNHGQQKSVEEDRSKPSVRNITHQGSPWCGEAAWLCIRPFGCGPLLSRHHVQLIPFSTVRQTSLPHLTNQSRTDSIFLVDYNHLRLMAESLYHHREPSIKDTLEEHRSPLLLGSPSTMTKFVNQSHFRILYYPLIRLLSPQ